MHGLLLHPGCLPEHPRLQRCVVSPQKDARVPLLRAGSLWHITALHLRGQTGSSRGPKRLAGCKQLSAKH